MGGRGLKKLLIILGHLKSCDSLSVMGRGGIIKLLGGNGVSPPDAYLTSRGLKVLVKGIKMEILIPHPPGDGGDTVLVMVSAAALKN